MTLDWDRLHAQIDLQCWLAELFWLPILQSRSRRKAREDGCGFAYGMSNRQSEKEC
jgi:hypothetical protein